MISTDRARWGDIFTDPAVWRNVVAEILDRHGLGPVTNLRAGYPGSHAVFIVNEALVVKIYAPFWEQTAPVERDLLAVVAGAGIVPVPQVLAEGSYHAAGHEWPYIVMDFMPGERLGDVWPSLPQQARARVAAQLGAILRRLHSLPHEAESDASARTQPWLATLRRDWDGFLERQIAGAVAHHRRRESLPPGLLAHLANYLAGARPLLLAPAPGSQTSRPWIGRPQILFLLHGDLTADHALLRVDGKDVWSVSALIDFGDARLGDPVYDFVAVSVEFMHTDPAALHHFFAAYGWPDAPRDPAFRRKLTALVLLHEFSDMRRLTDFLGGAKNVRELADYENAVCAPTT